MEEDPLIPLVHVWNNAVFDKSAISRAVAAATESDKENQRPVTVVVDVDAEITRIEAEIHRLSSRLRQLRASKNTPAPAPATANTSKEVTARARQGGLSLGPLDISDNPNPNPTLLLEQERSAARSLKPIAQPPDRRRRGVSLGPLEIHLGSGNNPASASLQGRGRALPSKLNAIQEGGDSRGSSNATAKPMPSRAQPSNKFKQLPDVKQGAPGSNKVRGRRGSTSPTSRRYSVATVGAEKLVQDVKPKGPLNPTGDAAVCRRPSGSSKVRVVASRYSLTPTTSLGPGLKEKRRKGSLPELAVSAIKRVGTDAGVMGLSADQQSPQSIAKVAELLPRIKTLPSADESPRDSGCAKRVADLVGRMSFFEAAAQDNDGAAILSYNARTLEDEAPRAIEA